MAKKKKDIKRLISEAKIYTSIEEKHQKLIESFERQGIKLEDKPIDEVEKGLLLNMQRLGMNLEENQSVREMAQYYGILPERK
jgi:hypothetical protein